ncbi:MAG: hypothetical protein M3O15_16145, partial [Acidobacteriota bacterium]|nr:hypothetical protein [Acidobacteriota bacterium]
MRGFTHLELHRTGIGLVPEAGAGDDSAIYVGVVPGSSRPLRSCTCAVSRKRTCEHLQALGKAVAEFQRSQRGTPWETFFSETVWFRLARLLYEGNQQSCKTALVRRTGQGAEAAVAVTSPAGEELVRYLDGSPAQIRFLERTGKVAKGGGTHDRAGLLERLALFQATPEERQLMKHGVKTNRQSWEESLWHRLAYHAVREAGGGEGSFHPAVDEATGRFTLTFRRQGQEVVQVAVPRGRVQAVLRLLSEAFPEQQDLAILPIPLRSIFRVTQETELDLEVRPVIRALQASGEERYLEHRDLARFRYGNLVYLKELGVLAELERPGKERKFRAPVSMKLKRSQVPSFLSEYGEALADGLLVLDEPLRDRRIWKEYDSIEVAGDALERSWYWLSVTYG